MQKCRPPSFLCTSATALDYRLWLGWIMPASSISFTWVQTSSTIMEGFSRTSFEVLPMVIHITNGIITDWGNPSFKSFGGRGSIALVQNTWHIIWICGLELSSSMFKKCTHAMAMGYFLWYIAYGSQPGIIVLVPICSLCGYLAGTITFVYPLATKLFIVYCLLAPKLFTLYALGAKTFVSITLPRAVDRGTSVTPIPGFYIEFTHFQMVSL